MKKHLFSKLLLMSASILAVTLCASNTQAVTPHGTYGKAIAKINCPKIGITDNGCWAIPSYLRTTTDKYKIPRHCQYHVDNNAPYFAVLTLRDRNRNQQDSFHHIYFRNAQEFVQTVDVRRFTASTSDLHDQHGLMHFEHLALKPGVDWSTIPSVAFMAQLHSYQLDPNDPSPYALDDHPVTLIDRSANNYGHQLVIGAPMMAPASWLREVIKQGSSSTPGRIEWGNFGDVRDLMSDPHYDGASFMAASNLNGKETTSPNFHAHGRMWERIGTDDTQGPAVAVMTPAATKFREQVPFEMNPYHDAGIPTINGYFDPRISEIPGFAAFELRQRLRAMNDDQLRLLAIHNTPVAYRRAGNDLIRLPEDHQMRVNLLLPAAMNIGNLSYFKETDSPALNRESSQIVLRQMYKAAVLNAVYNSQHTRHGSKNTAVFCELGTGCFGNHVEDVYQAMNDWDIAFLIAKHGLDIKFNLRLRSVSSASMNKVSQMMLELYQKIAYCNQQLGK